MIILFELKERKTKVTAVIFRKDEYTIEGIIRWLIDRVFACENSEETEKYFVSNQSGKNDFNTYEYMKIGNRNIAVEVGSDSEWNIPDINSLPDF